MGNAYDIAIVYSVVSEFICDMGISNKTFICFQLLNMSGKETFKQRDASTAVQMSDFYHQMLIVFFA